ncbi:MAG: hypothetical protein KC505_00005, partial [Myxococcales bacterium]|nr:hypothetical protein [Myxococcales bacterium]
MKKIILSLLFLIVPFKIIAGPAGDDFKHIEPYFYVAIAEASYEGTKNGAQERLNQLLGSNQAKVLDFKDHSSVLYGSNHFILVEDRLGGKHIAIEGSNSARNWLGNLVGFPGRGLVAEYDVPPRIRKSMQKIVEGWKKKHQHIISIVGHSQGGMYASQLKASKKDKYKHTVAMTFNGYKIKKDKNSDQYHFLIKTEHAASLLTSSGRYI